MSAARPGSDGKRALNRAAAEHLMNGFRAELMRFARRYAGCEQDAEDAFARTVEITLSACPIRERMAEVERWARVVCRRECAKLARRDRRKPVLSLEGLLERGTAPRRAFGDLGLCERTQPSPEDRALDAETRRELDAVIEALPAGQRAAIVPYARGASAREIARALGRSHRSVRKALWLGKRTLRARLAAAEEGP